MAFFLKSTFTTTVGVVIALGFLNTFADDDYYTNPCFDDENPSQGCYVVSGGSIDKGSCVANDTDLAYKEGDQENPCGKKDSTTCKGWQFNDTVSEFNDGTKIYHCNQCVWANTQCIAGGGGKSGCVYGTFDIENSDGSVEGEVTSRLCDASGSLPT